MDIQSLITYIIAGIGGLMTFVQILPIKVKPWNVVAAWFGNAINATIMEKITTIETSQHEIKKTLEDHIQMDDKRDADLKRQQILRFNADLRKDDHFSHEYFMDMLQKIDEYEKYCDTHPGYKNSRARMAIANIERICDLHQQNEDWAE